MPHGAKILLLIFLCLVCHVWLLENGLARTPPMGWMSWGYYECATDCKKNPNECLNEDLILSVADSFATEGYQEAGFEYIIIDDCWSEPKRDKDGRLVADKKRFPRGMKFLADYIHSRGLKFGMYTNVASITCMKYPGSYGHFRQDAMTFAEWGVDYLKVDGCYVKEELLNSAYIELGQYLNETGRPILYSCSWPYYIEFIHKKQSNFEEIMGHCNMWRNYHDMMGNWGNVKGIIKYYENHYSSLARYHGPGHWNDPDMLMLGMGRIGNQESRIQMAVFAMLSAPLLISCNMKKVTPYEKSLLQNLDLLAVGQDILGIMAKPYQFPRELTLWVKPHKPIKGNIFYTYSFAVVNLASSENYFSFRPGDYGLNSMDPYTVLDVFSGKFIRNVTIQDNMDLVVPAEDVVMYTFYPL